MFSELLKTKTKMIADVRLHEHA